ncbi:MAG: succinate dehydrogenase, cytochrome b556 subunit [Nitrospirae bacterium]|nr:succinate dehydrogenase, cytochrome b556 subunit [Nitrospirota bacterium]
MRYKVKTGSLAWGIHRITGISLTCYIFLHLYFLSHLKDPRQYEAIIELMYTPFMRLGELVLLMLVVFHALNGLRLTLMDLGAPTPLHKPLFLIALSLGLSTVIYGVLHFIRNAH